MLPLLVTPGYTVVFKIVEVAVHPLASTICSEKSAAPVVLEGSKEVLTVLVAVATVPVAVPKVPTPPTPDWSQVKVGVPLPLVCTPE